MAISKLIRNRRSCRKFTPKEIDNNIINTILETGLLAPTSKNSRPWEFIVVDDPELLEKLSQSKPHGSAFMNGCTVAIVIAADPEKSDVWVEDTSIAAAVMQLCAEELGIGSCWVQVRERDHNDEMNATEYVKETLSIPSNLSVGPILAFGYKEKERNPYSDEDILRERVHKNTF